MLVSRFLPTEKTSNCELDGTSTETYQLCLVFIDDGGERDY